MSTTATPLRIEPVDGLDSIKTEWSDLAESSRNIFATWEWTSLWWSHFGHERELAVAAALDDGDRIAAVLPLYFWIKRPGRILRFLGHGASDQLGPICHPNERGAAAALSSRIWRRTADAGMSCSPSTSRATRIGAMLSAQRCFGRSRTLSYTTTEADGMVSSPREARTSASRSAGASGTSIAGTRSSSASPTIRARLEEDLNTLFALHSARWSEGNSSFGGTRETFHRDFAACALERGWLRLWFLELDGQPVAAWHGFRFGGVESYYQAGRDPAWDDASVGFVLLAHSIRAALTDGVTEYRFLRGDDEYKSRFANRDRTLETPALCLRLAPERRS